jgi:hypothetical protein
VRLSHKAADLLYLGLLILSQLPSPNRIQTGLRQGEALVD